MAADIAALTLISRVALPALVGDAYRAAYEVVPLVALAYAFNGLHYALSPGVHLAGRTRWFPPLALAAAALNLGLNFLLIPTLGRMGAARSTTIADPSVPSIYGPSADDNRCQHPIYAPGAARTRSGASWRPGP
jgi:hypothetical protein